MRTEDQIRTPFRTLPVAVEVVGIASASAVLKLFALLRSGVVIPAREAGPTQTGFRRKLANVHYE